MKRIASVVTLVCLALSLLIANTEALDGFDYYIQVDIQNTNLADDVQSRIMIPMNALALTGGGYMQDDAGDLRLYGNGLEEFTAGNLTGTTAAWMTDIITVPASTTLRKTFWMGNTTADRDQSWVGSISDTVTVASDASLNITDELTLSAEINARAIPVVPDTVYPIQKTAAYWLGIGNSTKVTGGVQIASTAYSVSDTIAAQTAYDVVLTYDGNDLRISSANTPTLLSNGDFETGDPPTNWTKGAAGSYSQTDSTAKCSSYSMGVTRTTANVEVYQTYAGYAAYKGKTVTLGAWVKTTTANAALLSIQDGTGISNTSYQTGSGDWEWLTVSRSVAATATMLKVSCFVYNTPATAYFDGIQLVSGSTITATPTYPPFRYVSGAIDTNANDLTILQIDGLVDDLRIGGTSIASPTWVLDLAFEPDEIGATTIDDQSASGNDADYTLATNPADISVGVYSLKVASPAEADYDSEELAAGLSPGIPDQPDNWYPDVGDTEDWGSVPGQEIVDEMVESGEVPLGFFYLLMITFVLVLVSLGALHIGKSSKSYLAIGILQTMILVCCMAMMPALGWWLLVPHIPVVLSIIVAERSYGF